MFHIYFKMAKTDENLILLGCASAMNCPGDKTCENHECISAIYRNSLKTISFTTQSCEVIVFFPIQIFFIHVCSKAFISLYTCP